MFCQEHWQTWTICDWLPVTACCSTGPTRRSLRKRRTERLWMFCKEHLYWKQTWTNCHWPPVLACGCSAAFQPAARVARSQDTHPRPRPPNTQHTDHPSLLPVTTLTSALLLRNADNISDVTASHSLTRCKVLLPYQTPNVFIAKNMCYAAANGCHSSILSCTMTTVLELIVEPCFIHRLTSYHTPPTRRRWWVFHVLKDICPLFNNILIILE
jgi:hypothetical protein